jgi:hypothetical protein
MKIIKPLAEKIYNIKDTQGLQNSNIYLPDTMQVVISAHKKTLGRILSISDSFCDALGYKREDLIE